MELSLFLLIALQLEFIAVILYYLAKSTRTHSYKRACFIDTSVLMDGRISSAVSAGFVPDKLVIPQSVIAELQLLADGADSDKRARARHGLDVAAELKDSRHKVIILDDGVAPTGVDDKLIALAKKYSGSICTIDFNLNKVATTHSIDVLNINELAQQVRTKHLPGERVTLTIAQRGSENHQGVGYMADGTMVVVDQAKSDIGTDVEIEFTRSIQTVAGKMLFAKKVTTETQQKSSPRTKASGRAQSTTKALKPFNNSRKKNKEDALIDLVDQQSNS